MAHGRIYPWLIVCVLGAIGLAWALWTTRGPSESLTAERQGRSLPVQDQGLDLDLGMVLCGSRLQRAVSIENDGDSTFVVERAVSSCGCVSVQREAVEIPAHGRIDLETYITVPDAPGSFTRDLTLIGRRDGSAIHRPIRFTGTAALLFRVGDGRPNLRLGVVERKNLPVEVRIAVTRGTYPLAWDELRVSYDRPSDRFGDCYVDEGGDGSLELVLTLSENAPSGRWATVFELTPMQRSIPPGPRSAITVSFNVAGEFTAHPAALFFGKLNPGEERRMSIDIAPSVGLSGHEPIRIRHAETSAASIVRLETAPGRVDVLLMMPDEATPANLNGEIAVTVAGGEAGDEILVVPFMAAITVPSGGLGRDDRDSGCIGRVIDLALAGQVQQAAATLLAADDCPAQNAFDADDPLALTESEFVALPAERRLVVSEEITRRCKALRDVVRYLRDNADDNADPIRRQEYAAAIHHAAQCLVHEEDALAFCAAVAKAFQTLAERMQADDENSDR